MSQGRWGSHQSLLLAVGRAPGALWEQPHSIIQPQPCQQLQSLARAMKNSAKAVGEKGRIRETFGVEKASRITQFKP